MGKRKRKSKALQEYQTRNLSGSHSSVEIIEAGLVINPKWPWLGGSPDGIVTENGIPIGCIEIKCPYSKRTQTIKEAVTSDKKFYSTMNEGKEVKHKTNHQYYFQIRGLLNILELPWLDFVVYTTKDMFTERIFCDTETWTTKMMPTLSSFYLNFISPEIIIKQLIKSDKPFREEGLLPLGGA